MARMKIALPEKWQFQTNIDVRITDLNYGNHLANQNFLAIAQEARVRFFQAHGFSELAFGGASLIQADAAIIFKGEAFYGEKLLVQLSLEQSGNSSFNVFYLISKNEGKDCIAELRTALVCYNYDLKKVVAIPKQVLESNLFNFS